MNRSGYRGRFAPSPTGPLHLGSLVTAVAGYLDAKQHGGQWLVRMEDIDQQRVEPGAHDSILKTLEDAGLEWDEAVLYQSKRTEAYHAALDQLKRDGHVFACSCTRKETGDVYPGTCRAGLGGREGRSWRLRVEPRIVEFVDRKVGHFEQDMEKDVGDFVLYRADGVFAYQIAVVVDDHWQGITDVVRGADLLDSTPRQIFLQERLGLPPVRYLHLPVVLNEKGEKLSKQTRAPAVDGSAVWNALHFLGYGVTEEMCGASGRELLNWATEQNREL